MYCSHILPNYATLIYMEYLVITVMGSNQPDILTRLSHLASKYDCNIMNSRISAVAEEFTASLIVVGEWSAVAKMESGLERLEKKFNLTLVKKRTKPKKLEEKTLPYSVQLTSADHPGILYEVSRFFTQHKIQIISEHTNTFVSPQTETAICNLTMLVNVPVTINIADLRDQFLLLCEDLNFDGMLELET